MIGYPNGQDGPILPTRDCLFFSRNKISPKFKQVHEKLLLQNIFRGSKKIFCDFSVGMELENEKTESVNENENKENKTSRQRQRQFYYIFTQDTVITDLAPQVAKAKTRRARRNKNK